MYIGICCAENLRGMRPLHVIHCPILSGFWQSDRLFIVYCVTGDTGADLTFNFSDGVHHRGDICSYRIEEDDKIVNAYRKGWSVTYDPANGTLFSYCGPTYTRFENMGYYSISKEEYDILRNELENNRNLLLYVRYSISVGIHQK